MRQSKTKVTKRIVWLTCCFLITGLFCFGQRQIDEKNALDSLNAQKAMNDRLFRKLISGDENAQDEVIGHIKTKPQKVIPPVLYGLAQVLYHKGQKNEAVYWYVM